MVSKFGGRRWWGGIALVLAVGMLILGETALKSRLSGRGFLAYWLVCILLTAIAIVLALRDLRYQTRQARTAQRELLDSALRQIEAEARARAKHPDSDRGGKPPESRG